MRRASTLRYLVGAWITVAAILALAYFFVPESEPLPSQVRAAYERMPERRARAGVHSDERGEAEVSSRAPSAAAAVTSTGEVARVHSALLGAEPEGQARIHGTVRLKRGQLGRGVQLQLRREGLWGGWRSYAALSDDEGRYAFEGLPAGTYELVAGGGRAAIVPRVARRGITLAEEAERQVDISVEQGGRVWGRITDAAGRPVPRAKVLVGTSDSVLTQLAQAAKQRDETLAATSDDRGDYEISGVPLEREWRVWVDKEELAPLLTPPFVLHPTRDEVRMDVTLLTGTTIRGVVETPSGAPIPRAEVACLPRFGALLSPMRRAKTARDARSDERGRFELSGLPAGDYQLMGFRPGYRVSLKGKPVYPDGHSDIVDVRLVLEPALGEGDHAVFGQVVDDAGRPLEGARVGLMLVGGASFGFGESSATTDASGSFRFDDLCAGSFLLVVQQEGFRRRTLEGVRVDRSTRVELVAEARVEGRVVFPEGSAPSAFSVRVLRWEPAEGAERELFAGLDARTRSQSFSAEQGGQFSLAQVPPGRVVLEASAAGLAPAREEVRVAAGARVSGLTLRLSREGAVIAGRVSDAAGQPIAGAELSLSEGGGESGLLGLLAGGSLGEVARSDAEGRFRFERLADATYALEVSHPEHAPARLGGLSPQADQPPLRTDVTLRSGGAIEGSTRPGVMVTLAGEGYSEVVASDEQGRFCLEKVPPGSYLARAVVTQEDPTQSPEIYRSRVQVREGRTTQLSLAEAAAGVSVRGEHTPALEEGSLGMVLLLLPGSPSPDPSTLLWEGEPGVNDAEASRYVVGEALLQPDGSYVIHDVPPGRYVLTVYENSLLRSLSGEPARLIQRRELRVD